MSVKEKYKKKINRYERCDKKTNNINKMRYNDL